MSPGFYRGRPGFWAGIHPVTKLACAAVAYVGPFLSSRPAALLAYAGAVFLVALAAGARPHLRGAVGLLAALFGMSVVVWTVFYPGPTPLFHLGPLAVARESVVHGVAVGLRLACFVVVSVAFLTCTPIEDIAYGLNRLGMPYVASFALSLAFRLTPLFLQAGQQIALAQRARGLDLDRGGPLRRLRGYLPILVPVLLGGLRRADQLAVALELRGFGRPGKRTALPDYRFTWRDGLALLGVAAATGLVWLLGGGTAAA